MDISKLNEMILRTKLKTILAKRKILVGREVLLRHIMQDFQREKDCQEEAKLLELISKSESRVLESHGVGGLSDDAKHALDSLFLEMEEMEKPSKKPKTEEDPR